MKVALIAHDKKKDDIIEFVERYRDILSWQNIVKNSGN